MSRLGVLVIGTIPSSPDRLEHEAERILEILEDRAVGPVVGCDLERSTIDLRYSVDGESASDAHQQISDISGAIDEAVEGRMSTTTTTPEQLEASCV
jgi:multidrug efflux pump subunit AcrB